MVKKKKMADPLVDLLGAAKPESLITLIAELAIGRPDVRRECFDYLKKHASLTPAQNTRSEGEIVMALWWKLSSDLEELDDCGGGDYGTVDHVAGLLDEIRKKLVNLKIEEQVRLEILDEVLPFIKSGNAGLDDPLYDLAYATCYRDEDWRHLAQMLEAMNKDWTTDHARRIYRKLGDRAKYLELRHKKLVYGGDYHDLATFYWDEGNRKEALSPADRNQCCQNTFGFC